MDFELSDDQVALRDGIRSLCEGRFPIKRVRDGFDRAEVSDDLPAEDEARPARDTRAARSPFLRGDDSGGFGPNAAAARDDFDIPTVLRRQMD